MFLLIDTLPRAAADGILGDKFDAGWREYLRRREEIERRGDPPPPSYMTGLPESERMYLWMAWDHPDLRPPIGVMLPILGDWVRRRLTERQSPEADPK